MARSVNQRFLFTWLFVPHNPHNIWRIHLITESRTIFEVEKSLTQRFYNYRKDSRIGCSLFPAFRCSRQSNSGDRNQTWPRSETTGRAVLSKSYRLWFEPTEWRCADIGEELRQWVHRWKALSSAQRYTVCNLQRRMAIASVAHWNPHRWMQRKQCTGSCMRESEQPDRDPHSESSPSGRRSSGLRRLHNSLHRTGEDMKLQYIDTSDRVLV